LNVYYRYVYVYNRAQLLAVRRRNYIPRISTFDTKIKQSYYFPQYYVNGRSFDRFVWTNAGLADGSVTTAYTATHDHWN